MEAPRLPAGEETVPAGLTIARQCTMAGSNSCWTMAAMAWF